MNQKDKKKQIQLQKKHRILSWIFAVAILLLTAISIEVRDVYADGDDTSASTEKTTDAGTEKSTSDGSTPVDSKLLKDDHGRIVFWEWKKVTTTNYKDLFKRKDGHFENGSFYPSMLVMHNSEMVPMGFISTYADKDHVFYGPDAFAYTTSFNTLGNGDKEKIDVIYNSLDERKTVGPKATQAFKKETSYYIMIDSDSRLLNDHKEVFQTDRFYTAGTPMGVLNLSPVNRGETSFFYGKEFYDYGISVPCTEVQIALTRGSAKGNSGDMYYNSIGRNQGVTDYFMVAPADSYESKIILRDHLEPLTTRFHSYTMVLNPTEEEGDPLDKRDYIPADNESSKMHSPDEKVDFSNDIGFYGLYAYKGEKDTDKWIMMSKEGWSFLGVKNGYLLNLSIGYFQVGTTYETEMVKRYLAATDPSIYNVFTWYIGTPHVFASIKGSGGDAESGAGGTTTVGKGEMLILQDTDYIDADGNKAKSEGVVLPEKSKIVIEEGGVLSIEGNFINNGQIINKGGTIIIKDGGCVSSFGLTDEGTIECCAAESGQSGDIIVMPGGKLYSVVDDTHLDYESLENRKYIKAAKRPGAPALTLTGGSSLINYGTFVTNYTKMDGSSKIENRKESLAYIGYTRKDNGELQYYAKVSKSGIDNIVPIEGSERQRKGGIQPIYVTKTFTEHSTTMREKGTVLTEPTATLINSIPDSISEVNANYKAPEY